MPVEEGLDGLAKEILAGGRTYSVFDLAKLVMGARDRFNVNFQAPEGSPLHRCKLDNSLWLTKEEALRHFLRSEWRKDFYEEVVKEAAPPAGNFQTVARCGLSGEWLGPPNYHGYQPALMQLYRERFSNMPLDLYKKKIQMERGEEAVAAWLDKMSKRVRYRPTGGVREVPEASAPEEAPVTQPGEDASDADSEPVGDEGVSEEAPPASDEGASGEEAASVEGPASEVAASEEVEAVAGEQDADAEQDAEAEESGGGDEQPAAAESAEEDLMDDLREVERHFLEHHFDDAFQVAQRAWVSGNVPGNHLSPGLLTLLRQVVAEERRYPGKLTPILCRQLSGRHVAVFKWRRKLKAGPSRPHPVPDDIAMADRPKALLQWASENSGKKLPLLWETLLPKEVSEEEKRGWYHDLHWLLNQGYVLLMADGTVHLAKKPDEPAAQSAKEKGKGPRKAAAEAAPPEAKRTPEADQPVPAEAPPASSEGEAPGLAWNAIPGLYARQGRTLAGLPKCPEFLSGRGLRPRAILLEEEEPDELEGGEESW